MNQRDAEDKLRAFFGRSAPADAADAASSLPGDGLFLVRARGDGLFFLSYCSNGSIKHVPIVRSMDSSLSVKGFCHSTRCVSLEDLIAHLQCHAEGIVCKLSEGVPRHSRISEVSAFSTAKRVELMGDLLDVSRPLVPLFCSLEDEADEDVVPV